MALVVLQLPNKNCFLHLELCLFSHMRVDVKVECSSHGEVALMILQLLRNGCLLQLEQPVEVG